MRANRLLLGAALISMGALSACGTIMNGGDQTVDVVVKGSPTAFCEFTNTHFRNAGLFPNKVTLERSKEDLKADCKGEQNRHVAFTIPTHMTTEGSVGNTATGVVPGAAYDLGSGGMWAYPDPVIVDFRTVGDGPKPQWPADVTVDRERVGTAAIEAPKPVHMRPVMDEDMNPGMVESAQGNGNTEVIDAVRLAVDGTPVAITKTSTTTPAASYAPTKKVAPKMKPIASPEDDPAVMKAKQEAKAKAAKEAKRKAAEKAAAAKAAKEAKEAAAAAAKAEQEAKEAADAAAAAAAAQQQAAPAVETPPSDAALNPPSSATAPDAAATTPPPAAAEPAPATTPAAEVPTQPAPVTNTPEATPASPELPARSSEMPPEPAKPAEEKKSEDTTGQSTDMEKYLSGTP